MSTAAAIVLCIGVFAYMELAIFFGYYMFLMVSKKIEDVEEMEAKRIKKYSIIAGVAFPVTVAIIAAHKAAERR